MERELQTLKRQKSWRKESSIYEQTYHRWQKWLFEIAKQWERRFTEITPEQMEHVDRIAVTVRVAGAEVDIARDYTDLRRGIDGLATMVQQEFQLEPFINTLFLFCDRRQDRIKALYWEDNGFVLLYKRLEPGFFQWPRKESETSSLTAQQYRWLMEGASVDQPKVLEPVSGLEIV